MRTIIHDLGDEYDFLLRSKGDIVICADGKYGPCQGCFCCWTKHPTKCFMKDALQNVSDQIGQSEDLVIVTRNCYGAYSPAVKNVLDRSIGTSTPLSTFRGGQMHHIIRYSRKENLHVYAYGDMTPKEEETFRYMVERNGINDGYKQFKFVRLNDFRELEEGDL